MHRGKHPAGEWQLDILDWGVAVGIARSENAGEDIQSVTKRALEAARNVYAAKWPPWTGRPSVEALTRDAL